MRQSANKFHGKPFPATTKYKIGKMEDFPTQAGQGVKLVDGLGNLQVYFFTNRGLGVLFPIIRR